MLSARTPRGVDFAILIGFLEKNANHLIECGKVEHERGEVEVDSGSAQPKKGNRARIVGVVGGTKARCGLAELETILRIYRLRVDWASSLNVVSHYYFQENVQGLNLSKRNGKNIDGAV